MGPSAIRYANLQERIESLGYDVEDVGNIEVPTPEAHAVNNPKLRYLPEMIRISQTVCEKVGEIFEKNQSIPIILGGDHSISIGTVAGIASKVDRLGIIWFDAHADMNTEETTPSGNIHGMPLAIALGLGHPDLLGIGSNSPKVQAKHVVLVGARSIDPEERKLIRRTGIKVFDMQDIDKRGMSVVMSDAIRIASDGTDGIHLSFDLDSLDPSGAPGVGTPVLGGVSYREGHLAMELLAESKQLLSVDIVEVNPILDQENRTARTAVEMICSLLGEAIM
jgi:arginase